MEEFKPSEFDARKWAAYWMKVIAEHPGVPFDEETMATWFANAIMAGYDYAFNRLRTIEWPGGEQPDTIQEAQALLNKK